MDIKLKFVNNFCLLQLTDGVNFCNDGTFIYDKDNKEHQSITTGIITCEKRNKVMLNCIFQIIKNVSCQYYGTISYIVTGPQLLGINYEKVYKNNKNNITPLAI